MTNPDDDGPEFAAPLRRYLRAHLPGEAEQNYHDELTDEPIRYPSVNAHDHDDEHDDR